MVRAANSKSCDKATTSTVACLLLGIGICLLFDEQQMWAIHKKKPINSILGRFEVIFGTVWWFLPDEVMILRNDFDTDIKSWLIVCLRLLDFGGATN